MAIPNLPSKTLQDPVEASISMSKRNPSLTRRKTRLAALELLRQGKWPSYSAVRAITRRGSASDIKPFLKELFVDLWRLVEKPAASDGEVLHAEGMSSAVVAAVHALLDTLRVEAVLSYRQEMEAIEARANGARRREVESEQRCAVAQAQAETSRREIGRLLELRDALDRHLTVERAQRRKLEAANKRLSLQSEKLRGRRRVADIRSTGLRSKAVKKSASRTATAKRRKTAASSHSKEASRNRGKPRRPRH